MRIGAGVAVLFVSTIAIAAAGAGLLSQSASASRVFTSNRLGLSVDYPADWTVQEGDPSEPVVFRSKAGETIRLGPMRSDNPREPAPGRRGARQACTTNANPHGLTVNVCVDTIQRTRRAEIGVPLTRGGERRVVLTWSGPADASAAAFDAMVASARVK